MSESQHDNQVGRIQEKLRLARSKSLSVFGSGTHEWKLGPPLNETDVVEFESHHGIRLPSAYRAFLTKVGQGGPGRYGGAGPYYGIYTLERAERLALDIVGDPPSDWLRRPSPLRQGRNRLPDILGTDAYSDADALGWFQGLLGIGTQGCTYETALIVTGESSGRVAYIDLEMSDPYVTWDANFLDWYERFLDESLRGDVNGGFGLGPPGREQELMELLDTPTSLEARIETVSAFHRLAVLSPTAADRLRQLLSDPEEDVRQTALAVLSELTGKLGESFDRVRHQGLN